MSSKCVSAKLHSLAKHWLKRWLEGLWQCVQCGSAIVLKNVRGVKNKKHWVGLSVGSLVLLIFLFSVLSQGFALYFSTVVCLFTLGGNGWGLAKVAITKHKTFNQHCT
jgi:glucose uptake protein GlcU